MSRRERISGVFVVALVEGITLGVAHAPVWVGAIVGAFTGLILTPWIMLGGK